jgi:hypothetical protein
MAKANISARKRPDCVLSPVDSMFWSLSIACGAKTFYTAPANWPWMCTVKNKGSVMNIIGSLSEGTAP